MLNTCIICQKNDSSKCPLVRTTDVSKVFEILQRCKERTDLGEKDIGPLLDRLSRAEEAQQLANARYHCECRKPIMNIDHKERYRKRTHSESSSLFLKTPKRGPRRPEKNASETRPKRSPTVHKEIKCIFSACNFCVSTMTDIKLHKVETKVMGQTLLDIKETTKIDSVRVCVSGLDKPGDAAA